MTYSKILQQIHKVNASIRQPDESARSHLAQRQLQALKWRLIGDYVRARPFRDNMRRKRSEQWVDAMNQVRELLDQEVIDWLWTQADIARNFENGVQDMRPRRRGICHRALMEYLLMRQRKAQLVLAWEEEAQEKGCFRVNSAFHAKTREILARYNKGADEEEAIDPNDPWLRS